MTDKSEHTRRLNDLARPRPEIVNATWTMTRGVMLLLAGDEAADKAVGLSVERVAAPRAALARFSDWGAGNDPYGEHGLLGKYLAH